MVIVVASELVLLTSFVFAYMLRLQFDDARGCATEVDGVAGLGAFPTPFESHLLSALCGLSLCRYSCLKVTYLMTQAMVSPRTVILNKSTGIHINPVTRNG